jgi:fructokinase
MKKFRLTGIGEILWDMLPDGKMLGGAPANFCFHTQNLGAEAAIVSAIGRDAAGSEMEEILRSRGVKAFLNKPENKPSGIVTVKLEAGIPSYIIHENVAWDFIDLDDASKKWIVSSDAICFGTLAQRSSVSSRAILQALDLADSTALKIFDINLRQHYYSAELIKKSLLKANVLKINDEELDIISPLLKLQGSEEEKVRKIMNDFDLSYLALTLGSKGSKLFSASEASYMPVPKVKVVDTIGAGDSFTAMMAMELLRKKPLAEVHSNATKYAALVCKYKGATPAIIWKGVDYN